MNRFLLYQNIEINTASKLYLDNLIGKRLDELIKIISEDKIDWSPYVIFLGGILIAILIKKIYTFTEIKRLERIFFLWNDNLILNLKKQSEVFHEKAIEMEDIYSKPSQTKLYGIKTTTKSILEISQEKYFHIFISNRYKSKKLQNLFYRTFKTYNYLVDSEDWFMITRNDLSTIFDKAIESWNINFKKFTTTLNQVQSDIYESKDQQKLKSILTPHLRKYSEIQNKSIQSKEQIPKKVIVEYITLLEQDLSEISNNTHASKILDVIDNMHYSNILMNHAFSSSSRVYMDISLKYIKTANKLELYMDLWKKTKKLHIPLVKLYKPSDF